MTHCFSSVACALAAALLTLAACADRSPNLDTPAPLIGCGLDSVDLGAAPNAVVVADFDGDGLPDLAATSYGANGVIVTLGRRGGFGPPRAYPAAGGSNLVVGDVDGDGKVDLVVTRGVLLGKGDGTFGAMLGFDPGVSPGRLVAGDFNRDGKLDVAVANERSVRVLLGNGDGSFQPPKEHAVDPPNSSTRWPELVAGDIDGDGTLDLVATYSLGPITPLFGNGDGTFRSGATRSLSQFSRIRALAGGDFNGDGKLDLATVSDLDEPGHGVSVGIRLGNGDGTFHGTGSTGTFDHGFRYNALPVIAVADLDGDGKLDVVAHVTRSSVIVTALGKGDGTLGAPAYHRVAGTLVAVADVDGDGKGDVLIPSGNGVAVFAGNGDGTLRAPRSFQLGDDEGGHTGRVAVGDFNGDGLADVAVTYNTTETVGIDVLLADGRGGLRRASGIVLPEAHERSEIAAADVDGDGVLDLVESQELYVFLGNGDGAFHQAYRDDRVSANAVALGDFDGDGKLDAALYRTGQRGLTIMPGKGDGTFAKERQTAVAVDGVMNAVVAADLDGDGHTDLAVGTSGSLLVLLGKGDGSFAPARPIAGVPSAAAIAAADLDGDRRIDLVVAHAGERVSTVLLNAGGGAFRRAGTVPSAGKLRAADLDGDGISDLLVLGDALVVYRGKGDGTFEAAGAYGFGGSDFAVADLDGDGRPEVVVAAGGRSPFVSVLRDVSR
jgi:hypothetical protein